MPPCHIVCDTSAYVLQPYVPPCSTIRGTTTYKFEQVMYQSAYAWSILFASQEERAAVVDQPGLGDRLDEVPCHSGIDPALP
eukprot:7899788-Heterocapsa_arctica.AAC.1